MSIPILENWQISYPVSSFSYQGFKVKASVSSILIPHSRCLSFLGLSGLPFCHQAGLMSGPHSYGPARETNSCTEGEAAGNISSLSAPLGLVLREKVRRQGF